MGDGPGGKGCEIFTCFCHQLSNISCRAYICPSLYAVSEDAEDGGSERERERECEGEKER